MSEYLLGIDFGTEGVRVGVYDLEGRPQGYASAGYETRHPAPAWAEQDPAEWWEALGQATRRVLSESGIDRSQVVALGFDTTCCSVMLSSEDGVPLRPAVIWMDVRAAEEAAQVAASGSKALRYQAGPSASAEWMPAKALWLKRNEPERFAEADVLCEFTDWIGYRLTGRWTASQLNVTVRWYHQGPEGWPTDLYDTIGIPEAIEKFPDEIVPVGALHGTLRADAAEHLGLDEGIPVAQGGADAYVAMAGLDVVTPGRIALITGSSHLQLLQTDELVFPDGLFGAFPDALVSGLAIVEGGQISSGSIARWLKRTLDQAGATIDYPRLDGLAAEAGIGAGGLILLDYWQGNRTPHTDPLGRGAIWGMTLNHELGHLWRAVLEGVAYGNAVILQKAAEGGISLDEVRICGGVVNSPLWLQIHADVAGVPLKTTAVPEATCLGSAVLASLAAGKHATMAEASAAMVRSATTVEPNLEATERYAFYLDRYRATYEGLREEMHVLARHEAQRA